MTGLKLIALDAEDLAILAPHLQDAVGTVGEMTYLPKERRFVALLNRFDWAGAVSDRSATPSRRKTALRIERVLGAQVKGLDPKARGEVVSLLTASFEPEVGKEPAGRITLVCAGGKTIRLQVECIEVQLEDMDAVWSAKAVPRHDER